MRNSTSSDHSIRQTIIFFFPLAILAFILLIGFSIEGGQQFSELAQAFLRGHLYFLHSIGGKTQNPVPYNGHEYWSEGAFPAVLLMPFVYIFSCFHHFFYQGYLKWIFVLGVLYFIFRIAKKLRYTSKDSLILSLGFALGSVFIGVASVSSGWLFAQTVTAFLILWGLYEYYYHGRWLLIGIICGLIFLTRATAAPIIIFFILEARRQTARSQRLRRFARLCGPFIMAMLLQGLYNYFRFHSPFNGGYEYELLSPASAASRALGVFSPMHIPTNLYALLFAAPATVLRSSSSWTLTFPYIESSPNGLSIFITSPYLLYLFTQKWKSFDTSARNLLVAATVSCLGVLCFYGLGRDQFGYRYSLDFLPELFVVFMLVYRRNHARITQGMKCLLLGSGILNFYLLLSYIS